MLRPFEASPKHFRANLHVERKSEVNEEKQPNPMEIRHLRAAESSLNNCTFLPHACMHETREHCPNHTSDRARSGPDSFEQAIPSAYSEQYANDELDQTTTTRMRALGCTNLLLQFCGLGITLLQFGQLLLFRGGDRVARSGRRHAVAGRFDGWKRTFGRHPKDQSPTATRQGENHRKETNSS
jgi:hypothetical protein